MPLSRVTKLYSVQDAKISPLLTDPAGGSATYGTPIDVPGIQTMEISGDVETKSLRGDNGLLATNSVVSNIQVAVNYAKLSLDVLVAIVGGVVTDSGTTPAQTSTWDLGQATATLPPFKLEGVTPAGGTDIIGGDLHWVLHRLNLSAFPALGFSQEDYRIASFSANASPLVSTGEWITAVINETAVPIPTS